MNILCRPAEYPCTARKTCLLYLAIPTGTQEYKDLTLEPDTTGISCKYRQSIDHHPVIPIRMWREVDADNTTEFNA